LEGIRALQQQGAALTQQLKQTDALLAQAPPEMSSDIAAARLSTLTQQLSKAQDAEDEAKMASLAAKMAPLRSQVDTTGDLLAGVPLVGTSPSERQAQQFEEEYVGEVPPGTTTPDDLFTQQQKLENTYAERAALAAQKQAQKNV
jgi:hypothetical protein